MQIYIFVSTPDANCSLMQLRNCLDDNYQWRNESKVKANYVQFCTL